MADSQSPSPAADPNALASTPAVAIGMLMSKTAEALALASLNATAAQQAGNNIMAASTAVGVAKILGLDADAKQYYQAAGGDSSSGSGTAS